MKAKIMLYTLFVIIFSWLVTTLWAQFGGIQRQEFIGNVKAKKRALIVYNPDPFYNLDEQVCKSFAYGLEQENIASLISTIKITKNFNQDYDLYVFCANTYNFAPDWLIKRFIRQHPNLDQKNVVAITLGAGTTNRAKAIIEKELVRKRANLLASENFWLLRPNDKYDDEKNNIEDANQIAEDFGQYIGRQIK